MTTEKHFQVELGEYQKVILDILDSREEVLSLAEVESKVRYEEKNETGL